MMIPLFGSEERKNTGDMKKKRKKEEQNRGS